jgi:hypothetical protein
LSQYNDLGANFSKETKTHQTVLLPSKKTTFFSDFFQPLFVGPRLEQSHQPAVIPEQLPENHPPSQVMVNYIEPLSQRSQNEYVNEKMEIEEPYQFA